MRPFGEAAWFLDVIFIEQGISNYCQALVWQILLLPDFDETIFAAPFAVRLLAIVFPLYGVSRLYTAISKLEAQI
jgi:hypothetical protein